MTTKKLLFCIGLSLSTEWVGAQNLVDCKIVTNLKGSCNPYSHTLIHAKEVQYDKDIKKLIISRTLPNPKPKTIKIISVPDMIDRYIKIEEPLRFKGSDSSSLIEEERSVLHKKVSQTTDESTLKQSTKTSIKTSDTLTDTFGIYKVASGDMLGSIAQKFNLSVQTLLDINHLDKNAMLHIGKELKIPLSQKMVDSLSTAIYVIEKGDTLLSIAHHFNLDPKLLVKYNKLKSAAMIREGKKLKLPLPYVLKHLEKEEQKKILAQKEAEKKAKIVAQKKEELAKKQQIIKLNSGVFLN